MVPPAAAAPAPALMPPPAPLADPGGEAPVELAARDEPVDDPRLARGVDARQHARVAALAVAGQPEDPRAVLARGTCRRVI